MRDTIARTSHQQRGGSCDHGIDTTRIGVERLMHRRKPFRRIATRSEKRAATYAAMRTMVSRLLWLSFANTV